MPENIITRDATDADVPALMALRNQNAALHADRIRDARAGHLAYLVVEVEGIIVGQGLVVFRQPPTWPAMKHLPQLIDLWIRPDLRSHGLGRRLIAALESRAAADGFNEIRLGVDPDNNARARALYQRLGYEDIDPAPVEDRWEFTDSDGVTHRGVEQTIHMRKRLETPPWT